MAFKIIPTILLNGDELPSRYEVSRFDEIDDSCSKFSHTVYCSILEDFEVHYKDRKLTTGTLFDKNIRSITIEKNILHIEFDANVSVSSDRQIWNIKGQSDE